MMRKAPDMPRNPASLAVLAPHGTADGDIPIRLSNFPFSGANQRPLTPGLQPQFMMRILCFEAIS